MLDIINSKIGRYGRVALENGHVAWQASPDDQIQLLYIRFGTIPLS